LGLPRHKGSNPANTQPKLLIQETLSNPSRAVETLATTDVETRPKLREHRGGQPLGEDIGELRSCRDVEDTNVPNGNALADKVKINLNMLGVLVLNKFGGEVDGADVVAIHQSGPRQGAVQLHKQLTKPARLCHAVGHDAVLCLSA
jgi:hypothetical protein